MADIIVATENIHDFIDELEKHKFACEADGKYVEARQAQSRINELKNKEYQRKLNQLNLDHDKDREEFESAHFQNYEHFN